MKKETLLLDLLLKIKQFVKNQGYCNGTQYNYNAGINSLRRYFERKKQKIYSHDVAWEYVLERRMQYENGNIAYNTFLYTWKVVEMLECYIQLGCITNHKSKNWDSMQLCNHYEKLLLEYENNKLKSGYSKCTITGERSAIKQFLFYLESKGIFSISKIEKTDISEYIPLLAEQNPAGISNILTRLRAFFRYLIVQEMVNKSLILSLQLQAAVRKKVRLGFSTSVAQEILNAVDRSTNVGKRDYAMLLLAKHTGLRAIDVTNLNLQDIDWENGEIRIVQHKTKRPLILPLENNVGNAIAEYILEARPTSTSPIIFLRTKAPYVPLGHGNGSVITRRYAKRAGVMWNRDEYKGFHSFRHAIGTNMLAANVPLATISEVLGHSKSSSTKPYLSTDFESLKMCAMPLTDFECTKEELQ